MWWPPSRAPGEWSGYAPRGAGSSPATWSSRESASCPIASCWPRRGPPRADAGAWAGVAGGDVANHLHPLFGRLRVEHWNNGYQQGRAAARTMLGGTQPYDHLHSFWSDQYEHLLESVGVNARWGRVVLRGRPGQR